MSPMGQDAMVRFVPGSAVRVEADEARGTLRLGLEGESHEDVHFARAYPFSDPLHYIGAFKMEGEEICLIEDLASMDPASKEIVEHDLARRYFTPTIHRIVDLKQDATLWLFEVETSRGRAQFYVRHWRDSAYELSAGRWMIASVDGVRFEIPDWTKLDERSKRLLELLN